MRLCSALLLKTGINPRDGGGIFRRGLNKVFGKYLFATNTITSGILMGMGDIIQQELEMYRGEHEKHRYRYDWPRINRMFWIGLISGAPQHVFYVYLDRILPKRDFASISKKILADQFIASPIFILIFFVGMGWLEGRRTLEIETEIKDKFMIVYKMDWLVWPPAQFLNFYYIPTKYRVLYINFVTMLYDVFLSYAKHDIEPIKESKL